MENDYQKYVIKDGQLIGSFDEMYKNCPDPWDRAKMENLCLETGLLRRACEVTAVSDGKCGVIDLGCGLGASITAVNAIATSAIGIDVSQTAIEKASRAHPSHTFVVGDVQDFIKSRGAISEIDLEPYNLLMMCHLTWYILDDLTNLRDWLHCHWQGKYLVHILGTYEPGVQKYGIEYFSNHEEILDWWNLDCLEHGQLSRIVDGEAKTLSYFLSRIA